MSTSADTLIAANGARISGRFYEAASMFRENGDTSGALFVVHHVTTDGDLLLRRDLYPAEILAELSPRPCKGWTR